MINLNGVNQLYGGTQILWDLDLQITKGSCTCIMGRNGVGKTTLLKCLMGLLPVTSGKLLLDGDDFTRKTAESRAHNGIGYVPQGRDIFPLLTVEKIAKIVGTPAEILLSQMNEAGLKHSSVSDDVSDSDKKILLNFLSIIVFLFS